MRATPLLVCGAGVASFTGAEGAVEDARAAQHFEGRTIGGGQVPGRDQGGTGGEALASVHGAGLRRGMGIDSMSPPGLRAQG